MTNHKKHIHNQRVKIQGSLMLQKAVPTFTTGLPKNYRLKIYDIMSKQFNYLAQFVLERNTD